MLKNNPNEVDCEFPEDDEIELANSEPFRFNIKRISYGQEKEYSKFEVKGFKKSQNEWKETQNVITLYTIIYYHTV